MWDPTTKINNCTYYMESESPWLYIHVWMANTSIYALLYYWYLAYFFKLGVDNYFLD
jgi:hypothetical protein